jgi:hypothetical protein
MQKPKQNRTKTHKEMLKMAIKEMQIKTKLRIYLTPVRMAIIKNTTTNIGEDAGKKESSYAVGRNVN